MASEAQLRGFLRLASSSNATQDDEPGFFERALEFIGGEGRVADISRDAPSTPPAQAPTPSPEPEQSLAERMVERVTSPERVAEVPRPEPEPEPEPASEPAGSVITPPEVAAGGSVDIGQASIIPSLGGDSEGEDGPGFLERAEGFLGDVAREALTRLPRTPTAGVAMLPGREAGTPLPTTPGGIIGEALETAFSVAFPRGQGLETVIAGAIGQISDDPEKQSTLTEAYRNGVFRPAVRAIGLEDELDAFQTDHPWLGTALEVIGSGAIGGGVDAALEQGARRLGRGALGTAAPELPARTQQAVEADDVLQQAAGDDPELLQTAAAEGGPAWKRPSRFQQGMSLWRSVMLSNVVNRAKDVLDNALLGTAETIKDAPAAAVDIALEAMLPARWGGRVKSAPGRRAVKEQLKSGVESFQQVADDFNFSGIYRAVRSGKEGPALLSEIGKALDEVPEVGRYVEAGGGPISQQFRNQNVQRAVGLPFKLAGLPDTLFKPSARLRSFIDQAGALAKREGLKGEAARTRVNELLADARGRWAEQGTRIANPAVYGDDAVGQMMKVAARDADTATFMAEEGLAAVASRIRETVPYISVIEPFTRSASNVAERAFDYSPAGFLRAANRARVFINAVRSADVGDDAVRIARRNFVESVGRASVGTPIVALGFANSDRINTVFPTFEEGARDERALRRLTGQGNATIQIGDRTFDLSRSMGPYGWGMLIGAELRNLAAQDPDFAGDLDSTSVEDQQRSFAEALRKYGGDIANTLKATMSLQGLNSVFRVLQDAAPGGELISAALSVRRQGLVNAGAQLAVETAGSLVPAAVTQFTTALDPTRREAPKLPDAPTIEDVVRTSLGQIQEDIPIASRDLPAQIDAFGQQVQRPERSVLERLSPIGTQRVPELDPLRQELSDLGWSPSPRRDAERNEREGPKLHAVLSAVIQTPKYQQASQEQRQTMLDDVTTSTRGRFSRAQKKGEEIPEAEAVEKALEKVEETEITEVSTETQSLFERLGVAEERQDEAASLFQRLGVGAEGEAEETPEINRTAPGTATAGFSAIAPRLGQDLQEELGLTAEQAAGVIGSLSHETGNFEHAQEISPLGGGRGGLGWAQWTASRRRDFERWAAERDLPTDSYAANLGFLLHELRNTPEGAVLGRLREADSPEEAARIWTNIFERPGVVAMGARTQAARRALEALQ